MSTITPEEAAWFAEVFDRLVANIERAVLGRTEVVRAAATCLFSQGHLLLEDVSGSGKTTLARALARSVHGSQARIQFTPDIEPADITGTAVFDPKTDRYRLHPGPIFNSFIVADEINRASPRTQSALLEVMEEGRVTVQGITNDIGPPFMVLATQNPTESRGTFPLPEAQLDRFLMRLHLGHPDDETTLRLLSESSVRDRSSLVEPILQPPSLARACAIANEVYVDGDILRYIIAILNETRTVDGVRGGVSVRGGLNFVRATKTWAVSQGRNHVLPIDVQQLAQPVLGHRLTLHEESEREGVTAESVVDEVMRRVPEPA